MIFLRQRHLSDETLLEAYFEPMIEPRSVDRAARRRADLHLLQCRTCTVRYRELAAWLDRLRDLATSDVDGRFTERHLAEQHDRIMQRIESGSQATRVLSFPERRAAPRTHSDGPGLGRRWAAAAAAAGLLIGLGAGLLTERHLGRGSIALDAHLTGTPGDRATPRAQTSLRGAADDAFLSEVDMALAEPWPLELAAFDALTPRPQTISVSGR